MPAGNEDAEDEADEGEDEQHGECGGVACNQRELVDALRIDYLAECSGCGVYLRWRAGYGYRGGGAAYLEADVHRERLVRFEHNAGLQEGLKALGAG